MYRCKQCNLAVIHHDNQFHKGCTCNAPIIASMDSNLKGIGGITIPQQIINSAGNNEPSKLPATN